MTGVNANVNIVVNTQNAIAQIQGLQKQINALNRTLAMTGGAQDMRRVNQGLIDAANATGQFKASLVPVTSSVDQFTQKLEKNKFTLGEYTRYATSQLPGMSRVFRREFDTMQQVAESRVRKIATAYTALGEATGKAQKALALTPTGALDLKNHAVQAEIAAQRQAIFNKMLSDGSTRMLNWGKNTQWAGRQLMVGFSIPLAMLGTTAAKTFAELDKASISFKRVYGDLSTTTQEMERNLQAVKDLGVEYTKYGIAVSDTIDLAARAAATGAQNETLMAATKETLRLATLGQMDYNTALDATISMQTAFKSSNEDLATNIDFLNAVENQTVLTLQDMALAIPRVAPVVKGLGGDVKDLAIMMTAMREGGISAENGANALKSGLASLINPTKRAQETLDKFGIDLKGIIANTRGDVLATVQEFGKALSSLDQFSQQQALEQIFGKYQYARMGALFSNIINDSGQAARAMDLAGESAQNLAALSDKELSKISEATSVKFQAAMEKLKVSISPIGEQFMKAVMPIMDFLSKLFDKFNEMPDIVKNVVVIGSAALAGLGPVILMSIGLLANGLANITKGALLVRNAFQRLTGSHKSFQYIAAAELEATTATAQLEGKMGSLTGVMLNQQGAISRLITLYSELAAAASVAAGRMSIGLGGASGGGTRFTPRVRANKGLVMVPGNGNRDTVPAMLTPGESVMTKSATKKYAPILQSMNTGTLPGFNAGIIKLFGALKSIGTRGRSAREGAQSYTDLRRSLFPKGISIGRSGESEYQVAPSLISQFARLGGYPTNRKVPQRKSFQYTATAHIMPETRGGMKWWRKKNTRFTSYAENDIMNKLFGGVGVGRSEELTSIINRVKMSDKLDQKIIKRLFDGKHPTDNEEYEQLSILLGLIKSDKKFKNLSDIEIANVSILDGISGVRTGRYEIPKLADKDPYGLFTGQAQTLEDLQKLFKAGSLPFPVVTRNSGGIIPGKGNKDTVPALLTPGESVITKEATAKYGPILQAMNSGKIKGFAKGGPVDPFRSELSHGTPYQTYTPGSPEYEAVMKEKGGGRNKGFSNPSAIKGYTNWVYDLPRALNKAFLSGEEAAKMFSSRRSRNKIMRPIIKAIAQQMQMKPRELLRSPDARLLIRNIAENMGKELGALGTKMVSDKDFYSANEKAVAAALKSGGQASSDLGKAVGRAMTQITTVRAEDAAGKSTSGRVGLGRAQLGLGAERQITSYKGTTSAGNWESRLTQLLGTARAEQLRSVPQSGSLRTPRPERLLTPPRGLLEVSGPRFASRPEITAPRGDVSARAYQLMQEKGIKREDALARIRQQDAEESRKRILNRARVIAKQGKSLEEALRISRQEERKLQQSYEKEERLNREKAKNDQERTRRQEYTRRQVQKSLEQIRQSDAAEKRLQKIREASTTKPTLFRRGTSYDGRAIPSKLASGTKRAGGAVVRGAMPLSMTLGMGSMLPMMAQDEEGKFMGMNANTAMMGMMGGSMVLGILPMLEPLIKHFPMASAGIAAVGAAAAAAGFAVYKWRDSVDSAAREAADFGSNLGGAANAVSNMASILGVADPITTRKYQQLSIVPEEQEAFAQYSQMLAENEEGKKFIEELKSATSPDRFSKLTDYLRSAVAAEMLTVDQAKLFAKAVGAQLGDVLLGIRAGAEVGGQRSGSSALMELAQQREAAALDTSAIQRTIESTERDSLDVSEASTTVSAGIQIIKAYNQAIAKAQQEYEDGSIQFDTLVDRVDAANIAIGNWEKNIKVAYNNVNDFGALMQGSERALDLAGVGEQQKQAMRDAYSEIWNEIGYNTATVAGATERFVTAEQEILPALGTEGAFQKLADLAEKAGETRDIQGVQRYVASENFDREAFNQIAEYGKNLLDTTRTDMLQMVMKQAAVERGLDPLEAVSMMKTIATDMTAMNAFVEGGSTVESFMNAIVVANSEIMFASEKLQQSFMNLSSQLDITGQSEAFRAYIAGAENEQQRETRIAEIQAVGAGMSPRAATAARSGYLSTKTIAGKYYDEETVLRLQQTQAYQQALTQTKTATVGRPKSKFKREVQEFDDKELREINEAIDKAGEAGISGDIVEYALKISVEEEKDPSKTIEEFTEKVLNLQGLDEEIRIALGIDINDGEDVSKFGDDVDAIERGWSMLSALNPNIDLRFAAKAAILDENGNPIDDPAKIAKNIMAMNKAYAALEKTGGGKSKKEAQIELVRQFQTETTILDEEGKEKEITPEQIVNDANKTLKKIGKSIDDLPAAKASQVLQIQTSISDKNAALNAKLAGYMAEYNEALADVAAATTPADRASAFRRVEAIGINIANTQKQARDNKKEGEAQILTTGIGGGGTPSGSGGGGGAESPLKGFKQGILDQVKMWVDANAQMSDLNNAKKNFVQSVLKGNSLFAKLSGVKGVDVSRLQEILGMGPKGVKEFIDKYIKGGKLTKEGASLLDAAAISGAAQTIGEAVIARRTAGTQIKATRIARREKASKEVIDAIAGDPAKAAQLVAIQKKINQNVDGAVKLKERFIRSQERSVQKEKEFAKAMDPAQYAMEEFNKYMEKNNAYFDKQFADIEANANILFKADYGKSVGEMELQIERNDDLIDKERERIAVIQDSIRVIETRQGTEKNYSDWGSEQIQKAIDDNNDLMKILERRNEIDQRRIDAIQRESDLRSREIDVINRDLDDMSEAEDKINEAYDKRIEALDEVTKINDRIVEQQRQQIDLSRALSTGDIYSATAAAREMQASSAQFAAEQFRTSLEQGRENEISALRTSGGLTREQAEERIGVIEEQNYQASLRMRDIQDAIYNRQVNEILPLKDTEYNLNLALEKVQDSIAVKQKEIRDIERGKMEELQRQNDIMREQINDHLFNIKEKQSEIKGLTGETKEEFDNMAKSIQAGNAWMIASELDTAAGAQQARNLAEQWANVAQQIENAKNALSGKKKEIGLIPLTKKYTAEDRAKDLAAAQAAYDAEIARIFAVAPEIKQNFEKIGGMGIQFRNAGGMIEAYRKGGAVGRDSVPAMLTPGEFVIRKAMVDKYGMPMFDAINQGSFSMPRYDTRTPSTGNVVVTTQENTKVLSPMYNNYSVNVNVSGTNASADDIANHTIMKIKQMQNMQIRGNRGY